MPVISDSVSVAANARSGNVLAGSIFEFMPMDGLVNLLATGSAAGLRMDSNIAGGVIAQNALIPATNRFPIKPDDSVVISGAAAGSRLFLEFVNTTGGALTAQWLVEIAG